MSNEAVQFRLVELGTHMQLVESDVEILKIQELETREALEKEIDENSKTHAEVSGP